MAAGTGSAFVGRPVTARFEERVLPGESLAVRSTGFKVPAVFVPLGGLFNGVGDLQDGASPNNLPAPAGRWSRIIGTVLEWMGVRL